jgi:hypothetical protein
MVDGDYMSLVKTRPVGQWRETLAVLATYTGAFVSVKRRTLGVVKARAGGAVEGDAGGARDLHG